MLENIKDKTPGRAALMEPVIISGKCFGIKLLSVYDFMLCTKMLRELTEEFTLWGFDKKFCSDICERACVVSLCLHDLKGNKIFSSGISALKNLTSYELRLFYNEYIKLQRKILRRDKVTYDILESVKKRYKKTTPDAK